MRKADIQDSLLNKNLKKTKEKSIPLIWRNLIGTRTFTYLLSKSKD